MREIIFRGKRMDNGEWAEGFYISHLNACHYIIPFHTGGFEAMDNSFYVHKWFEVDPSTIGQYTGLKDKNGERVWEGDILSLRTGRPHVVRFKNGVFILEDSAIPISFAIKFDIIGNIHDNPELLKEEALK